MEQSNQMKERMGHGRDPWAAGSEKEMYFFICGVERALPHNHAIR
jgi:hypothetical protein